MFPTARLDALPYRGPCSVASFRYSTHVYRPTKETSRWVTPISHRNHVKLLIAPNPEAALFLFQAPAKGSFMMGREALLTGEPDLGTIPKKSLERRPHCQEMNIRLPEGAQSPLLGGMSQRESRTQTLRNPSAQDPLSIERTWWRRGRSVGGRRELTPSGRTATSVEGEPNSAQQTGRKHTSH